MVPFRSSSIIQDSGGPVTPKGFKNALLTLLLKRNSQCSCLSEMELNQQHQPKDAK